MKSKYVIFIYNCPKKDGDRHTNGSRSDTGRTGSGIFSITPGNDVKISIRNPDHCSVFRSELIAISGALDHALNSYKDSIWILTDSRSSIEYLKNWSKIMDSTGLDILSKLVRISQRNKYVSSGYHHMWVCLGTKLLMIWLVGGVISLTPVPLS
ncbi:RNase H domain-containing protein [Trichonephila clavipes]|nr:RNase H domain-containing protein [Trichonephila clavipes]